MNRRTATVKDTDYNSMEFANKKSWKHCSAPLCNQLDFLPFHCKECDQTFCADHQQWKNHNCQVGLRKLQGRVALPCDKCGHVVSQLPNKTIEESILAHQAQDGECASAKARAKRKRKKRLRCSAKGCKESVRAAYMQFHCKGCLSKFCVKHRAPADHHCDKAKRERHYRALSKDRAIARRTHERSEAIPGREGNHRPTVAAC